MNVHARLIDGRHGEAVTVPATSSQRGGPADVIYVLCLVQVAALLLAAFGEMLLMGGNPLYLVPSLAKIVLLLVLAAKVVSGRRWAIITLIVVQAATLAGFLLQLVAGILPWVDFTVNLVGLMTNLTMPTALIYLCGALLVRRRLALAAPPALPVAYGYPPPQDPFAASPTLTTVVQQEGYR